MTSSVSLDIVEQELNNESAIIITQNGLGAEELLRLGVADCNRA